MSGEKEKPAEEVKAEQPEEKKVQAKPASELAKEEKKSEAKPAEAPKGEGGEKLRKVSRMTLAEVETELKAVKEKMGGFQSSFARHLLARKSELTN